LGVAHVTSSDRRPHAATGNLMVQTVP
jgi:hypothetical protein